MLLREKVHCPCPLPNICWIGQCTQSKPFFQNRELAYPSAYFFSLTSGMLLLLSCGFLDGAF